MKQLLLVILPLLFLLQSCGNKLSRHTESLVEELEKHEVMRADSSYMSMEWEAYQTFIELKNTASLDEIASLIDHQNPVVQGYAIWALVDQKYPKLPSIFSELLALEDSVVISFADEWGKEPLAYLLYQRAINKNNSSDIASDYSMFYANLTEKLDSLIIYSKNLQSKDGMYADYLLHRALLNNQQDPASYTRVRDLVVKYDKQPALGELAKYQKEKDIDAIKGFNTDSFEAISHFSHPAFWEFLLTYKDSVRSLSYFKAIASFKDEKALKQLSELYEQISVNNDIESIKELDRALIIHYTPTYSELILKIFEQHKVINESMTRKLLREYPKEASKAFANGLMKKKPFHFIAIDPIYTYQVPRDSIFTLMLNAVKKYDQSLVPKIYEASILSADLLDYFFILEIVREEKLEFTISVLLQRLDQKNYPFATFHVAKTLLMFEDQKIKEQVAQILEKRKSEWDSGNWSDNFQELFKEYNISF